MPPIRTSLQQEYSEIQGCIPVTQNTIHHLDQCEEQTSSGCKAWYTNECKHVHWRHWKSELKSTSKQQWHSIAADAHCLASVLAIEYS